jgi:hypothetical protein
MKVRIAASVIVSVLGLAPSAYAQAPADVSARERAWGEQLGAALGKEASQVRRPKDAATGQTSGLTTWLRWEHGGTFAGVTRLKFESPAAAQAYAHSVATGDQVKHDTALEVRGDQVVVVVGPVTSPELVRTLTDAAWGGLPAPDGPSDTALTRLRDGSVAITTHVDGPVRDSIQEDLSNARAIKAAWNSPNFTQDTPDSMVYVEGVHARFEAGPDGASTAKASSAEGYAAMRRHVDALREARSRDLTSATQDAAVGAANVIEGLFGR